jgi:hypothetical protein
MTTSASTHDRGRASAAAAFAVAVVALAASSSCSSDRLEQIERTTAHGTASSNSLLQQGESDALAKSRGCVVCHTGYVDGASAALAKQQGIGAIVDAFSMHASGALHLGCVDCHGGDAAATTVEAAHPRPNDRELWSRDGRLSSANPEHPAAATLHESLEWIRFVNPGDLRAAPRSCGAADCHPSIVTRVRSSMMAHGAMLWSAALYANGAVPDKTPRFAEAYSEFGEPLRLVARPAPSDDERRRRGWLDELWPLPRWEVSQPGNVLRVFERGGGPKPEIGNPNPSEPSGDPQRKLSFRGFGTLTRTDPVFLGLQKTRLLDPTLNEFGTNDHPGDYRGSGCSACHVLYANDRDSIRSGAIAKFGNRGRTATSDPTIALDATTHAPNLESGHPLKHVFTRSLPTSSCIVCHVHPGTSVTNSYCGTLWYGNETDGEQLYPPHDLHRTADEVDAIQRHNPEGAAVRGLWGDREFLAETGSPEFNAKLANTQLADFHGHGWLFRNVYQHDRHGKLQTYERDERGEIRQPVRMVPLVEPKPGEPPNSKFAPGHAVHLMDVHLEKGMHCADCHFEQDSHGSGHLHGELRGAIEITCSDCHGTVESRASLVTSGPAAPPHGTNLESLTTPFGTRRFVREGGRVVQRSVVEPNTQWEVVQVLDTVTPGAPHYNAKSARAKKLCRADGSLAHPDSRMTCAACHTSWTTSCFGCHLPMAANRFKENLHNEGQRARNWTSYNFQTLRDDVYMLAIDGTVTGNRISPARSACAVLVSSQDQDRNWIYSQQQTISAEGFSGQAFSTYVPHTVRGAGATKQCSDCHVSRENDNNAWMAQLLLLGTGQTNFVGRYCYVATGEEGFDAAVVTEHDEPQAVIGSNLHRVAYPDEFAAHVANGRVLAESVEHSASDVLDRVVPHVALLRGSAAPTVRSLQLRGEYLYAACGRGGLRVFDVADVDVKNVSEKTVSAPVSPLGQRFVVRTRDARAVAAPVTTALDPVRTRRPANEEQPIHLLYAFLYVADFEEGLILVNAATLLDGDPQDNFLERTVTFDPDGVLDGATNLTVAGEHVYVCCKRGLVVVSVADPLHPKVVATIGAPQLVEPTAVQVQFRYAFVTDRSGLHVVDVTDPDAPKLAGEGAGESADVAAFVPIADARNLYVARTHAYVAAGRRGLAIVDVERPERPVLEQTFDADGAMDDVNDVKVATTNDSVFAYVADGAHGLRVVELVTSGVTPGFSGFTQRPTPRLVATRPTSGPALAVSRGLDRDRAVDESGHQLSVFDRRGARPFTLEEMRRLYVKDGKLYTVSDDGE